MIIRAITVKNSFQMMLNMVPNAILLLLTVVKFAQNRSKFTPQGFYENIFKQALSISLSYKKLPEYC